MQARELKSIVGRRRGVVVQAVVVQAVRITAPGSAPCAGLVASALGLGRPRSQRNGRQAGIFTVSTESTESSVGGKRGD